MVRWYRRKIAHNSDTGQQIPVFTNLSDWDERMYPTLFFEYFNKVPVHNTFTLLFPTKLEGNEEDLAKLIARAKE